MIEAITTEPSLRYQVQKRYRTAPPAPYKNPWQLAYSYVDYSTALDCIADEEGDNPFYVYRAVDAETDDVLYGSLTPAHEIAV